MADEFIVSQRSSENGWKGTRLYYQQRQHHQLWRRQQLEQKLLSNPYALAAFDEVTDHAGRQESTAKRQLSSQFNGRPTASDARACAVKQWTAIVGRLLLVNSRRIA